MPQRSRGISEQSEMLPKVILPQSFFQFKTSFLYLYFTIKSALFFYVTVTHSSQQDKEKEREKDIDINHRLRNRYRQCSQSCRAEQATEKRTVITPGSAFEFYSFLFAFCLSIILCKQFSASFSPPSLSIKPDETASFP